MWCAGRYSDGMLDVSSAGQIAGLIDHAILHPTLTDEQARRECEAVAGYPIATVCVKPCHVALAKEALGHTRIGIGTVIGFPHGVHRPAVKAKEAELAFADGAAEVDMVVNTGKVLSGAWDDVREDIRAVLEIVRGRGGVLKVIFETDFVTADADKIRLCEICSEFGVDFVKTSTGFGYVKGADGQMGYRGATEHDVALMRRHCPTSIGIKASGGIRTLEQVLRFVQLGATRIGTSSTAAILREAVERFGGPRYRPAADQGSGNPGY